MVQRHAHLFSILMRGCLQNVWALNENIESQDELGPKKLTERKLKVPMETNCNYKQLSAVIFYRYLLALGRKSSEVPDPNKEAVINQWVEWESTSLQVGFSVGEGEEYSRLDIRR